MNSQRCKGSSLFDVEAIRAFNYDIFLVIVKKKAVLLAKKFDWHIEVVEKRAKTVTDL